MWGGVLAAWALLVCMEPTAWGQEAEKPAGYMAHPEAPVESVQSVVIGGQKVEYRARAGTVSLYNGKGEERAKLFYVAYEKVERVGDGEEPRSPEAMTRPITFSFNGGPGSSSVWLHLGVFGPRRVAYADEMGNPGAPPYRVVENGESLLDVSDFVFIDPVSTGFSRSSEGTEAREFHGVESDIASVGEFIVRYLSERGRWSSPKFIVGESYGTTRAAGLAEHLFERHGVALNGVMLISTVLDFGTIRFGVGNDLPFVLFLPSYTATAHHHGALSAEHAGKPLGALLDEVERFALGEYASALLQGDRLSEASQRAVAGRVAGYTGLSAEFVMQSRLRVSQPAFCKELLRGRGLTVGRFESRMTGRDRTDAGATAEYDPSYAAIQSNYTASLNDYLRRELGYTSDLNYEILTGVGPWNYEPEGNNRYLNVAERLRSVMHQQPTMRVFVASGWTDLATPYFATEQVVMQMGLAEELRGNVEVLEYAGGHMMYLDAKSLPALSKDLRGFYGRSVGRR